MHTAQTDLVQHNGFVISDERGPRPKLIVGVGDSVSRLVERNPFLKSLNIPKDQELRLPLLRTTDVTYDDGRWKLDVGCVTTSNLDGDERFAGVETVGLRLCDPALNDWQAATARAAAIVTLFRKVNPDARDLSEWLKTASRAEYVAVGGDSWTLYRAKEVFTKPAADEHFKKLDGVSSEAAELSGTPEGVGMGIFMGEKVIYEIGVSKHRALRGDNLTEQQRKDRLYLVTMSFRLRSDVTIP
jgi:hypothetical protein